MFEFNFDFRVSFRFVSFRFVSFRFVSFRFERSNVRTFERTKQGHLPEEIDLGFGATHICQRVPYALLVTKRNALRRVGRSACWPFGVLDVRRVRRSACSKRRMEGKVLNENLKKSLEKKI